MSETYKSKAIESKPSLKDPVFNRGCCKFRGEYVAGQKVLNQSGAKMNEFNWMKDYEGVEVEGAPRIAEVRFKNDHKDFYLYPKTWIFKKVSWLLLRPPSATTSVSSLW